MIARNGAGIFEFTAKAKAFGQGSASKPASATPAAPQQQEQPQQPEQKQPQQEAAESKPVPLDEAGEGLLQEFKSAVPGDVLVSGMANVIASGELSNTDVATLSKHMGISQDEARAKAMLF